MEQKKSTNPDLPPEKLDLTDQGPLQYAVEADLEHGLAVITFSRELNWWALGVDELDEFTAALANVRAVLLAPRTPGQS